MPNNNNHSERPLTKDNVHEEDINVHLDRIEHEFREGFMFLRKYPKSVSIFGSSMAPADSETYKAASALSEKIVRDLGYSVFTGGGAGIMEAANKGAHQAGGESAGLTISLPHERTTNEYMRDSLHFTYFFTRKTMLTFAAEAYVFFPGGFGTFDELMSILTLIQTGKIPRVPVILFGSDFWKSFAEFLEKVMRDKYHTIDPHDMELFEITDSPDRAIEIIKKAPVSEWWRNIN